MMKTSEILIIIVCAFFGIGLYGYLLIRCLLPKATVTSWWRTPEKNIEVGGVPYSKHLIGWGYDVSPNREDYIERVRPYVSKIIATYPAHFHVEIL